MIRGRVGADGAPRVAITIHGRAVATVEAAVDTGFSEHLRLARRYRRRMTLAYVGDEPFELVDGRIVRERVYRGEATFDGVRQSVLATLTRSADTLIGTALLRGKTLAVDFRRGRVTSADA